MAIAAINPATGETIRTYTEMGPGEAHNAVNATHRTWLTWRRTSFAERAALMKKAAGILRSRKDELAKLMALEMGDRRAASRPRRGRRAGWRREIRRSPALDRRP